MHGRAPHSTACSQAAPSPPSPYRPPQISLVDQYEQVIANLHVKPEKPVVSYLTPLTGLTRDVIERHGVPLQQALDVLRSLLPKTAVLVGQNINKDVQWLKLREGVDFAGMVDLAGLWRAWNAQHNNWSVFGQDHLARVLLGWELPEDAPHDAVYDALKSIRLFNYHNHVKATPGGLEQAHKTLLAAPIAPSFAKRNPSFEGVCMGNRKTCTCGAPFFSS